MVDGITAFRNYFNAYTDNYIIIGGTACDIVISSAGLTARATRDIDIILVVEALTPEFVAQFWLFVREAGYKKAEKSETDRKYYRFREPENSDYPFQIELFSRVPDLLDVRPNSHLTAIPVDDKELSSLSAILMNDDYYYYTLQHCSRESELHRANIEALICLKARAYLDMIKRKEQGENIDTKNIKKHKADIFRLSALLTDNDNFELPPTIFDDLQYFIELIKNDLPDSTMIKSMGLQHVKPDTLFSQLKKCFKLD
ncbi:hypothetical protein SAMN04488128_102478 [Chitinophaga eiseniae]|uniref:Nucleotidyl transferase AbiEii toxin, Type IV TA system n=1 Tax=Chitinophaga eiseniae TaxID=634771 RepID=A0A1T4QNG6_9BACT|nr:hypothetical protein [Chitinophaga eiseniae]SKA05226.1 hypothetical protein SAMN04488128_102478 [Chitinophaga eiseniae]